MVYLFGHKYCLNYNVLLGLIIRSDNHRFLKRVNGKIIYLCTRSDGNLLTLKFIGSMVSEFRVFKDEEPGKYMFSRILLHK